MPQKVHILNLKISNKTLKDFQLGVIMIAFEKDISGYLVEKRLQGFLTSALLTFGMNHSLLWEAVLYRIPDISTLDVVHTL